MGSRGEDESVAIKIPKRNASSRFIVATLLNRVLNKTNELLRDVMAPLGRDDNPFARQAFGRKTDKTEFVDWMASTLQVSGRLVLLAKALDELRDELELGDDIDWVRFQVDFCFDGNTRMVSSEFKTNRRAFLKEAAIAHTDRFSDHLGDFKKIAALIRKPSAVVEEETFRIITGLIMAIRESCRDISIHREVIAGWMRRCGCSGISVRSIFRKEAPPVTGDGLTEKSAWQFPLARSKFEGVAMAHEFMRGKGPKYRLRKQAIRDINRSELLEYWERDAGTLWFRYRMDPRLDS